MRLIAALCSCFAMGVTSTVGATESSTVWLVVAASDKSPQGIAAKAEALSRTFPGVGLTFSTSDCGDKNAVFGWAADIALDAEGAKTSLARVRASIADAYLKQCHVKPRSLLDYRIPAVDRSIAAVPTSAVSWDDGDRVSAIAALSDGRSIAMVRAYNPDGDDPLEGKRTSLLLLAEGKRLPLREDCYMASAFVARKGRVALQCTVEQAADNLLHEVAVYAANGAKLASTPRCAEPQWVDDTTLRCKEETLDARGALTTRAIRLTIPMP
jgi:hypothetical protein